MKDDVRFSRVDFHCHLDLFPDYEDAVARAEAAGVYTLTVTTTPKAWPRNFEMTRGTRYVRAALGLHPQLVANRASELSLWERYLPETRYIGEVGLDASPCFYKSLDIQKSVFRIILKRCAEIGGKILTVHSLRSVTTVLDMIEQYLPPDRGAVVLHWFTGSRIDAQRAVALGCYFSIDAEMTRSDRGKKLISDLPADRLLTETDGPFTRFSGHPAEPDVINDALKIMAHIRNTSFNEIACIVSDNFHAFVNNNNF
jgi:TatD DNase family protein